MTESSCPHQIDVTAHLSKLPEDLSPQQLAVEYTVLKPALADLYKTDRAQFSIAAYLVKEKLKIGRRDLEASLKPLQEDGNDDECTVPSARFPELVDLVEEAGDVRFLVISEHDDLRTEMEWRTDNQLLVPPTRDHIPWSVLQA